MARPTDWDAIGLSGDPTPGDPEQIRQLSTELKTMGGNAREISAAIDAVMNTAGDSIFVGQAADALRGKVDDRLRGHIEDVAQSFEKAADALTTWADKLVELQGRADGALNAGRGLSADDPQRETYATTARGAGTEHGEAAGTAASSINGVANIQLPISQCQVFWEAFQWLAIILIIPALIFGGPIALLALGVNLTLFIKTIVDFAKGDANFLDLFLAGLGIIAPTTKALPIFQIIKAGGTAFAKGFKAIASTAFQALRNLFTNGFRFTTIMPGLRDFVHLSTTWIRVGGLWVMQGIHNLPGLAGMVIQRGGITVVQGLRGIPGVVRGLPEIISGGLAAGWKGLGRGLTIGWEGLTTGAKATYDFGVRELGGGKWLRLLLPVDAGEIGQYGLGGALRIGFFERGVMGQHIFGAPLAGAVGHGISAVPIPHGGPHGLDALVDMPRVELGNVRLGDWAGANAGMRPFDLNLGPVDLASALRTPSLHMGNVGAIGDRAGLGFHASRQLDALVDIPKAHLNNLQMNGFTPFGGRTDAGLGVSAASSAPSLHSSGLYLPGSAGAPAVQGVNLATGTPVPGAAHSALTAVQAPPPGAVGHLDTLLPGAGSGAHGHGNILVGGVQTPPPGTAAAGNLLTPGTPGPGNGVLHSAVTGAQAPPPVTAAGHDLAAGVTPGGAAAGGHVPIAGIGQAHHGADGTGASAFDLLAAGGRNGPQSPVPAGSGAQFGDRTASALTANQTRLHLDELLHSPGSPRSGAVPDRLTPGTSAANGPTPSPVRPGGDTLAPVDGTRAAALDLVETGPGVRPADTHAFAGAPAKNGDAGHAFAGAPARTGDHRPAVPATADDLVATPVRPDTGGHGPQTPHTEPHSAGAPGAGTAVPHHGPDVSDLPHVSPKGKGRATPATPHDLDATPPGGDWRATGDASVALTDTRRAWDDALDDFEDIEQRHLQGVGSSGHADGSALAHAWDRFVRADMDQALAERQWSEATGGSPLPEVREVEARYGVLPGGSPVSRWLRGLRGHHDVPAGPPGVVQSVTPVPPASHVVIDGTRAGEATGRDVHVLIPTSRDLTVAHWLQHPADAQRAFQADMDALTKARAAATHDELITALDTRIASLTDDLELFRGLEGRPVWNDLRTPQVAALVMVERRALRSLEIDRAALISKLRSGDWAWAKPYLVGGGIDGVMDSLVTKVLHHLRNDMTLTVNVDLGKAVKGTGGSVLDAMVRDNTVLVRNAWEATPDHLRYLFKSRGPAEESLGYAGTVKRTGGPDRAGVYPGRTNDPGELFAPTDLDRSTLPGYAALTSSHRPQALQQYGSAVFHLKPQVMERATFTPTDSFGRGPRGAEGVTGLGNMAPLLNHGPDSLVRLAFAEATDFAFDATYRGLRDSGDLPSRLQQYIEAQIHGRITWQDLDRVVLFHDGADAAKAGEALTQKTVLETFARDNNFSFTVDTVPVFPKPRRGAAPAPAAGAGVHESFEDLRFTAGLLDPHGAPRADLLDEAAKVADTRPTPPPPAPRPKPAPAPPVPVRGELSRETDLFHTVNLELKKLGQGAVSRAEFDTAFHAVQGRLGTVADRLTVRALSQDVTAQLLGHEFPRLRGGMHPTTAGDDLATGGPSGAHQAPALPAIDNRSVVGIPGHDGIVVRAERGTPPELVGNATVGGHRFEVVDVQRGGAQFTVRELDAGGSAVHSWTYKRLGPQLRTAEESMAFSDGHFGGSTIKITGNAVGDVSVGGSAWPAKLVGDGEIHVASPAGNQVYDRATGTLIRTETSGRPPVSPPADLHLPPAEADSWKAATDLARTHLGRATEDNSLKLFMQGVIGGAFTSKKGYGGFVNPSALTADAGLVGKVEEFNKVTRDLLHQGANEPMTVWRGVAMDPHSARADVFIERLPASTSNNRAFQAEWAKNGVNSNRVVFEIEVPANHGKLAMAYPPGYEKTIDDAIALSDQSEVTLSPTRLVRTGEPRVEPDGITVIPVRAEQIPNAELPALIRAEWEGLPSGTAFDDFGRAFEQGAVRQWEGLGDAVVRTEATDTVKTFVVSRPGLADELTVTVTHHPERNAVEVSITGGDRTFTKEWSGTGFSSLAADLRGTVLHNNELFNPLPTPSSWQQAHTATAVRTELSRETDLFHTVNLELKKLGQGAVSRAEFQTAFHAVQDQLGTVADRLTVRVLSQDVTAQLLGHPFPRVRGAARPTTVGDDLAAGGPSGSHQPAPLPPVDNRSVVGVPGQDGFVVRAERGKTPELLGNPVAGGHRFDVVQEGPQFTVRELDGGGTVVHSWTYKRLGPNLRTAQETMSFSDGHFAGAEIKITGNAVADMSVGGSAWPAKLVGDGEIHVASPAGNQVYDRATGTLIRTETSGRPPVAVPGSVSPGEAGNWTAAADLARAHLGKAAVDNDLKLFMQNVIGGAFTSKKGYGGYLNAGVLEANPGLIGKVEEFNRVTKGLLHEGANEPMTVWRGVAMDPHAAQADVFIERLPASTSNNRGFQAEWAKNGVNSNRVVFEIEVPANHGKLAMDYPPGYERASDDVAVALSDQSEVTLSPTRLVRTGEPRVEPDGITVIPVRAEQIPNAELPALLREEWQGLPSGTAFEDFGRAFEQGAVRRWEGLGDAIVRTEGINPDVVKFVVSRPGYPDELTVTVTHHAERNAVEVSITGGERAFTKEWSGTGFSNLAADLRGTVLHNNDLFNPLPTPASWREAPTAVRTELSRETDLFHTVNLQLQKRGEAMVTRAEFQQAYHVVQDRLGTLEGRLTVRALSEDVTAQLLGHEFPRLRGGVHPTTSAGDDLATAGPSGSGSHQPPAAAPTAHTPVDLTPLNNALEGHAGAGSKLRQVENDLAQLSDNSPKLSDAQAKVDDALLNEQKATAVLDGAVDDLISSRSLTQVELNSLVDRLAGSSYVDQAVRLRAHGDDLDVFARTPEGAGRPDQGVWTGPEIRTQAGDVRVRVADLENALLPGSPASRAEIQGLVDELKGSAGRLGVMTDGFIKDAARLGGAYALRAQNKALVVAVNHYVKLVDDALTAARPGEAVHLSEPFLVGKAARGLSGGAVDVARRYRVWGAYKDVPTGKQWTKVLPDAEGNWAQAIGDFPDNLTPTQKGEFVKNLSGRNIQVLREEFDTLLGKLDAGDAQALRDLRARVENLPHHIKHATPAYHTMANSGFMMSQGELERRGLKFLASGKSSVKNTSNLGNDDFVFFRMESGKAPMQTRYGPTTMIFDAKVLEERGGWVSLHDQLNPLDRPTMRNLEFEGKNVRAAEFDEGFTGTGERARWTYTYPDRSTRTVSFEQEVFHGAEVREGLALSVVREVQSIGGDFKAHALRVMDNPDELGKVVSDLFRPEAKFGGNLPFTPLGSEVSGRWAGLVDVHNPAGDGRYLPDGTVDPIARAAGKQHDEALDKVRQADNGIASGHTNSVRFNLRKAELHAQQSVDLTDQFRRTATGDRLEMAEKLFAERTKLLDDIKARLAPAAQAAPPAQPPVAALGTAGAQPPAAAVASVEDLLRRPAPWVEGALKGAGVAKANGHMVSVAKVLAHSDGFRPLLNSKVDLETKAAFGLSKNQFSKAFSALKDAGLVRGADDGLHLTDKGRELLLPPGTATDAHPSAPTPPAVAHDATTTPPPAGTHGGGADPWTHDSRALDDLLGGQGQPARQHYADLTSARTDLGKAEDHLRGGEAGTSQHVSVVDQHHQGEVLAARGREADAFHQLQDAGVDPLAVDGRMHEINERAAVERGAINAGSGGTVPREHVPVSTDETPLFNSAVSGENGLLIQRSVWENGDRTHQVLGNDLAAHPDYTVTVRRDGGFDVRHAPSDTIATYNDNGLRIAHDLPLLDSTWNATGSRLHVELDGRGHATDATVTGPGGQAHRVELFRGDVVRVTDEFGSAARFTIDGRPWNVLDRLDGTLSQHGKAVEELQGVEQQLAQKTETAAKDGKAVTGTDALQGKINDVRGKETLARQAVTDAVQDLMDARYLSQDEVNHLVERFAGLGDVEHAEMLQAHARRLDELSRDATAEEPAGLWQRIWTGQEIADQSALVENRAVRLHEALNGTGPRPTPDQLRGMAGELRQAADDLDTGLRGFVRDAAGSGGVYGLRNAHTPWAAVGRHYAKLVDEAVDAAGPGAPGSHVLVRDPAHPDRAFDPRAAVDRTRSLTDLVRRYRTDQAFKAVPAGTQWKAVFPGDQGQWSSVFADFERLTPAEQTSFVRTLSETNVHNLRTEVDTLLAGMPDPVRAQFLELRKQLDAVPYHVKHATPAYRAIENSGQMASQGELGRRGQKFYASGKSSANNTSNLGNDDFVFFRMEAGDAPMQTRYGPTTLVFDAKVLEERGGWVSLHDQLNPLDRPAMQSLEHGGQQVRTAAFEPGATGTGARTRWTYTYPDKSTRQVSFEQEVFHGEHVREGLTLSVMREVASIGGDFQKHVLGLLGTPDELGRIVTRMFRPEAKFGGSLPITAEGVVAHGDWPSPVKVWNADGDGRYFPDGTVDPVARASGKQFDLASDRLRQALSGMDSIEATGKRTDLTETGRAERITGIHRNVRWNLRKAHQHVTTSLELTQRFHASAEGARKELAQRLLDERNGLLRTIEEKLAPRKPAVQQPPVRDLAGEIARAMPAADKDLRQVIQKLVESDGSIEIPKSGGPSYQDAFGVGRNRVDRMTKESSTYVYAYQRTAENGSPIRVIALSDTARELFLSGRTAPEVPVPSTLGGVTHEVPAPAPASGSGLSHTPAPAAVLHEAPAPKPVDDALAGGPAARVLTPPKAVDGVLSRPSVLDDLLAGRRDGGPVRHIEETRPLGSGSGRGTDAVPPAPPAELPSRPALVDDLVVRPAGNPGRPAAPDLTVHAGGGAGTARPAHTDLLDPDVFRNRTATRTGIRSQSQIHAVDQALNDLRGVPETDFARRADALDRVVTAADGFLRVRPGSERAPGVRDLRTQARDEAAVYRALDDVQQGGRGDLARGARPLLSGDTLRASTRGRLDGALTWLARADETDQPASWSQYRAVEDLLGGEGRPFRQRYSDLTSARTDLGKAEDHLRGGGASTSQGVSAVDAHTRGEVLAARERMQSAYHNLRDTGLDPHIADQRMHAVNEQAARRGAVNAGGGGSGSSTAAPAATVTTALSDPGPAGTQGLRIERNTWADGSVTHRVVDQSSVPDPDRTVTVRGDGGFDVRHTPTDTVVRYDQGGVRIGEDVPMRDAGHQPTGMRLQLRIDADGRPADPRVVTTGGQPPHAVLLGDGHVRVTDTGTGVTTRFTAQGHHVDQGIRLSGGDGALADADRVLMTEGAAHHVTDLNGARRSGTVTDLGHGNGFRVTDDATGGFVVHGADGRLRDTGVALADAHGVRGGLFVVDRGAAGHVLTDAAGTVRGERLTVLPENAGFRVTDDATGGFVVHGADGRLRDTGVALADAHGVQ
ncbi:hypothetical protein PV364_31275, partial [Streptomyces sp. MI02-7b]|nr:hypothetical protein [Streptomyces sp. MI02-7b]